MATDPDVSEVKRLAGWLPDQDRLEDWLQHHRERAHARDGVVLHPTIQRFKDLVEGDAILHMDAERMVREVPQGKRYRDRPIESWSELLLLMNEVLTVAPEFGDEMAATPLGAVLDWPSATTSGFAFFRDARVNAALHDVLVAWCEFLDGPESRYVLNASPTGWLSERARKTIGLDQFEHDPDAEYCGFRSWNDFFTRRLRPGVRPVAAPEDDGVIVNACESRPYAVATAARLHDRFWLKGQPYSLADVLAGDPSIDAFVGGTVYQAFLSANNYHRWHSPVAGTVVRAFVVPGTFFSEADATGAEAVEPIDSQGYLAHVATRAIILIEADDPAIGLVAVVPIGMVEVSSCRIRPEVRPGHHLAKGEELGHFRFGGSTHCVLFRPGVLDTIALDAVPQPNDPDQAVKPVNSLLAIARRG